MVAQCIYGCYSSQVLWEMIPSAHLPDAVGQSQGPIHLIRAELIAVQPGANGQSKCPAPAQDDKSQLRSFIKLVVTQAKALEKGAMLPTPSADFSEWRTIKLSPRPVGQALRGHLVALSNRQPLPNGSMDIKSYVRGSL